jgi:hypothetical protein
MMANDVSTFLLTIVMPASTTWFLSQNPKHLLLVKSVTFSLSVFILTDLLDSCQEVCIHMLRESLMP